MWRDHLQAFVLPGRRRPRTPQTATLPGRSALRFATDRYLADVNRVRWNRVPSGLLDLDLLRQGAVTGTRAQDDGDAALSRRPAGEASARATGTSYRPPLTACPVRIPCDPRGPGRTHGVTPVAAVTAIEAGNDDVEGPHDARLWQAHGPAVRNVCAARLRRCCTRWCATTTRRSGPKWRVCATGVSGVASPGLRPLPFLHRGVDVWYT